MKNPLNTIWYVISIPMGVLSLLSLSDSLIKLEQNTHTFIEFYNEKVSMILVLLPFSFSEKAFHYFLLGFFYITSDYLSKRTVYKEFSVYVGFGNMYNLVNNFIFLVTWPIQSAITLFMSLKPFKISDFNYAVNHFHDYCNNIGSTCIYKNELFISYKNTLGETNLYKLDELLLVAMARQFFQWLTSLIIVFGIILAIGIFSESR